ncbi:hypothetical protein P153DRAFT_384815 [Dothidotthia symphoricarpi CBS 119687]|uniref:RGS domain-containing protein n=1 Tax=Dothidotthia symphoricarpi CBS 119687 TaxID=1392245 RepID=A0A6A6AF11_9PLEO|nr:uncharacterized protein P153DRAFT_384815 [Dothidotthia symphoricarpi CBS 119687]KAF2130552.1 hypothetical protein P153DRAFT_384815 [Dothidotthia symphoricarpi CBS 119687]
MPSFLLDSTGWTYMGMMIVWTVAFIAGVGYLWINRQLQSLRMRRIPLLLAGLIPLHLYGVVCLLSYLLGPLLPCTAEYWVMNLYLPFGIAIFHATNSQFLHIASRQKQFAHMSTLKASKSIDQERAQRVANSRWRRIFAGVERSDNIERTLLLIGVGIAIQILLALFIFLGSEKFHPGWGLFNYTIDGTGMEARMNCSKGWEWWLSIIWQFFWAWFYAPYMLWKSRGVRDVHGWRIQTICCCIVGLPATPLWLAGLYIPQMAPVNAVMPPPVWFSACIFFMEIFTLGFPIAGVIKGNKLRQETLEAIADWEKRQERNSVAFVDGSLNDLSLYSDTTALSIGGTATLKGKTSFESSKSDLLTMTALENALRTNALPLLEFAALKDFSGENVSFLTLVADWRRYWLSPRSTMTQHRRRQFLAAVRIYAHFISLEFSEFPINISSKEMKTLHSIFEKAAVVMYRTRHNSLSSEVSDSITPFDNVQPEEWPESPTLPSYLGEAFDSKSSPKSTVSDLDSLGRANLKAVSHIQMICEDDMFANVAVPDAFNEMVFDAAETEIKYLTLINTWPRFVNAGRAASQASINDEEKGNGWKGKMLCSR